MNHVGSETHRLVRRSNGVTRRMRRLAAALSITAATVLTAQADTAGAVVSCSLRVVDRDATTLTLRYDPHDNVSRTVWVDGQPTTIAPHTTAVVPAVEQFEYVNRGDWLVTADLIRECGDGSTTTTTSSTTTSTVPTTTSTSALTTITVVRVTPEPTTSTAPLPPATWTVVEPTTTMPGKQTTLPETGGGITAGHVVLVLWFGGIICLVLAAAVLDQIRRKDDGR